MIVLCALDDIADPGARAFVAKLDGDSVAVFVVRQGGQVYGYVNSCPHLGAPLNMEDNDFLDLSGERIICRMHGARFAVETGECLMGPCIRKYLRRFPVVVRDGAVVAE